MRLDGDERLRRVLERFGREGHERIEKALDKSASEIEARARQAAPADSGDLRGAIEVRDSLGGISLRGIFSRFQSGGDMLRVIGVFPTSRSSPGWYAPFLEFGTVKMSAQPFLLPAYFSVRKRVRGRIKRAINRAAKDAVSGG